MQVTASGFSPGASLVVTQCANKGNSTGPGDCNLADIRTVTANSTGQIATQFTVVKGPFGTSLDIVCGSSQSCLALGKPGHNVSYPGGGRPDQLRLTGRSPDLVGRGIWSTPRQDQPPRSVLAFTMAATGRQERPRRGSTATGAVVLPSWSAPSPGTTRPRLSLAVLSLVLFVTFLDNTIVATALAEHPDRFECRSQRPAMDRQCVRPHLRGADAHFRHPRRPSRTAAPSWPGGVGGVHRSARSLAGRLYQRDSHRGPGGDGRRGGRLRAGHPVDDPSALSRSRRTGSSPRRVGSRLRSRPGLGTGHRGSLCRRVVVAGRLRLQHRSRTGRPRRRVADPAGGGQPRPADAWTCSGFVLGAVALIAGTFATIAGETTGYASWWIALLFAIALGAAVAFVYVERRAEEPVLDLHYFRDRAFAGGNLVAFTGYFATFAVFFFIPLYLQLIGTASPDEVALDFLPMAAVMIAGVGTEWPMGGPDRTRASPCASAVSAPASGSSSPTPCSPIIRASVCSVVAHHGRRRPRCGHGGGDHIGAGSGAGRAVRDGGVGRSTPAGNWGRWPAWPCSARSSTACCCHNLSQQLAGSRTSRPALRQEVITAVLTGSVNTSAIDSAEDRPRRPDRDGGPGRGQQLVLRGAQRGFDYRRRPPAGFGVVAAGRRMVRGRRDDASRTSTARPGRPGGGGGSALGCFSEGDRGGGSPI